MHRPPLAHSVARVLGILLLVGLGCSADRPEATARRGPPNLLVILADDLSVDEVGLYAGGGSDRGPRTPNLDRLGHEGVVFDRFWSMPSCSPTRAALLTGEYPTRNGVGALVDADLSDLPQESRRRAGLSETAFTLPRALAEAGYASALVGKWHVATGKQGIEHPLRVGFDRYRGSFGNLWGDYFRWAKVSDGTVETVELYATTDTTDDAIAFASELPEPWLLIVSYNAPHAPAHAPPPHLHGFGEFDPEAKPLRAFRAMVEAMNREIGRLLTAVGPKQPFVFFLADNGTPNWVTPGRRHLHIGKGTVFEGGLRVPLIVNHASLGQPGRRSAALAGVTDLFATLVELSGARIASARMPRDSVSLAPMLRSDAAAPARDWLYAERFRPGGPGPHVFHLWAVRDERYKLIKRRKAVQFFDLIDDPEEKHPIRTPSAEAAAAWARLAQLGENLPAVRRAAGGPAAGPGPVSPGPAGG